jgi:AcrR family transcriptional regulator
MPAKAAKTTDPKLRERKPTERPSAEQRIAEAALQAFAAHGFDGVSTTEIAALAGISQPMVYYHVATKDEMWRAAVDRLFVRIFETFPIHRDELRDLDAVTKLKILLRRFVLISARYPALGQLVVHEGSRSGERLQWLVERHFRAHHAVWSDLIEQAQAEGSLKRFPSWLVTILFTGAASSIFNFNPMINENWGKDVFAPETIETQAELVIEAMFHGLATDRKPANQK